jgi:putative transposase
VHPTQISQWKRQALDGLPDIFISHTSSQAKTAETLIASLFQQVDQLKVQVDHLAEKVRSAH